VSTQGDVGKAKKTGVSTAKKTEGFKKEAEKGERRDGSPPPPARIRRASFKFGPPPSVRCGWGAEILPHCLPIRRYRSALFKPNLANAP